MFWSVDAELEEILGDAKAALAQCNEQPKESDGNEEERTAVLSPVNQVKQNAEADKETLVSLVKRFLVRRVLLGIMSSRDWVISPGCWVHQSVYMPRTSRSLNGISRWSDL
jgi:hypothetical protein